MHFYIFEDMLLKDGLYLTSMNAPILRRHGCNSDYDQWPWSKAAV